ncbi:MAG: hypothetical protein ABI220_01450 [Candidatus Saccharimonadales bacterium]
MIQDEQSLALGSVSNPNKQTLQESVDFVVAEKSNWIKKVRRTGIRISAGVGVLAVTAETAVASLTQNVLDNHPELNDTLVITGDIGATALVAGGALAIMYSRAKKTRPAIARAEQELANLRESVGVVYPEALQIDTPLPQLTTE